MRTTKLEAVNAMLDSVGEDPVDSLETGLYQADTALRYLERVSKEVQAGDWHFNQEFRVELTPDTAGIIQLPANCIEIDASNPHIDVQERAGKLYDIKKHTFVFDKPVKVDWTLLFDFEELPEVARQYIYIRAARKYQKTRLGSDSLDGFLAEDERDALQRLHRHDSEMGDYNMFDPEYGDYDTLYITERF